MLSIENSPPDPPCPPQFLQLKSGSDEKLPLPELDLLKHPSIDHQHIPLPKFSIRDYVFGARSKDIKKNWPFSPENLLLCLKHGLNDPLPPFEPVDAVRNQSRKRCTVETNISSPFVKQNTRKLDEQPFPSVSNVNDHVVPDLSNDAHSNHVLAGTCIENSSCRFGEHESDLPSTTSASQSEIDSVEINKQSNFHSETHTSVEAAAAGSFKSQKTENTNRPPSAKKCRLVVKFGAHSDRSSTEDIASNCTTLSESMASKVCPVCKTFSSSSNTTLNAHIDQCLSVESTPKGTADSKLTRHRIKPRKTRLMVDVYATAKPCTLEELDRRNGTSWATTSNVPRQDPRGLEIYDEGKKRRLSPIHPKDAGEVGAVYIDANGTKLRILSKFNEVPPVSKVGEDLGPSKSSKGSKGAKFFPTKKRRRHMLKHHKYLKLAPQSRKIFSHKSCSSTIVGTQEGYRGVEENSKTEGPQVPKKAKSTGSRNLRECMRSKRADLSTKPNDQDRHQPLICKWNVSGDSRVQNDQSRQVDHVVERYCVDKFKNSSESQISSPEKRERIEKPVYEVQVIDKRERSFGRKRVRNPLFGARIHNQGESSFNSLTQNTNQSSKSHPYVDEEHMDRSVDYGDTSSLSKKSVAIDANGNHDSPVTASTTISHHSFASKCFKISSLKKNVLSSGCKSSMVEYGSNLVKNYSTSESQLHFMEDMDEEATTWGPEADEECVNDGAINQCGGKENTKELSSGGRGVHGARKQRERGSISGREKNMALKSIQLAPSYYDCNDMEKKGSSARSNEDILDKVDALESAESVNSLSQSVETKFNQLSNASKNRSGSLHICEDYGGPLYGVEGLADHSRPSLVDKPSMFCSEVDHGMIGQTTNVGGELDSDAAQGNSFPEVDPIPIPGPPGSFLPSPRDMMSDDFQGNSSLTTSRIQSSQDQVDLVDGDPSDSPMSAVSTISNSAEAKSDMKYAEPLAFAGAPTYLETDSSCYFTEKPESLVENGVAVPQTTVGPERTFGGEKFRVKRISMEKRPLIFKNDDQPCCCQRKERTSQGFALNFQDSQLLKRRTMASMMVPALEMQIDANPNIRPNNSDARADSFSLSSSTSLGSGQMTLPVMKQPPGPIPFKGCSDAGAGLSSRGDCDSASPSSSNPILRLMGKNLMVVNKGEDASVPLGQSETSTQSSHLAPNFPTPPSNIMNQGGLSFHQTMTQGSLIFDQSPNDLVGQSFDARLTNGYRNRANYATLQTPVQFQAGMFVDEPVDRGFIAPMELYRYEGNYSLPTRMNRSKNKLGHVASPDQQHGNGDSAASSKEVIIIDDSPESEADKSAEIVTQSEGLREIQHMSYSYGISMPSVPNHVARQGNPFSRRSEDPHFHNTNFKAIPSRRLNPSPVRWDCTSQGSIVLQRSPFMAVSPSSSHLRSVYYSPSLS